MRGQRHHHVAIGILLAVVVAQLAACGPDAKQRALRSGLVSVNAARDGFLAWDNETQQAIVVKATSHDEAIANLDRHATVIQPVVFGFELTYKLLAAAALDPTDDNMLILAGQLAELFRDVQAMTGHKLSPPTLK